MKRTSYGEKENISYPVVDLVITETNDKSSKEPRISSNKEIHIERINKSSLFPINNTPISI